MKKPPTATAVANGSDPDRYAVAALATTVVAACPPGLICSDYTEALQTTQTDAIIRNSLATFALGAAITPSLNLSLFGGVRHL